MTGEILEPPTDNSENGNATVASIFSTIRICLAVFGLLANTITGVVLTNKRLWNPTSMLLLSLVAYDAVFLLASIPPSVMFGITDPATFAILLGICYPMRYMAQTGSIYTTVTVTVERFLIVFRPLKARVFCTFGKTRKLILGIFIFSMLFNIPRCFFYNLYTSFVFRQEFNTTPNSSIVLYSSLGNESASDPSTSYVHTRPISVATESDESAARREEDQAYYIWLYMQVYELYISSVLFYLLPYTLIPILNIQLLMAIQRRREETSRISVRHSHRLHFPKPTDLEDGLTLIVLGITVCFFICCLIPAIYNVTQIADVSSSTDLSYYLLTASDTMLCVNASTDFFFYCLLGRKFRNVFIRLFCPRWYIKRRRTNTSSYYNGSHKNSETCYYSV